MISDHADNTVHTLATVEPGALRPFENFPLEALDDLGVRERWLPTLPEAVREPARRALEEADALARRVAWKTSRLMEWLGCRLASETRRRELSAADLGGCRAFLRLVDRGMDCVDRIIDRRFVARSLAVCLFVAHEERTRGGRFTREAEGIEDAVADTQALEEALSETLEQGGLSAWTYLSLGEISTAERVARSVLTATPPLREPSTNPFDASPMVHISTPRLEAYVREDREALGAEVFGRIDTHVDGCDACSAAADSLRL